MNSYPSEVYKRMSELYQALADGKKVVLRDADKVEQTVTALHPDQAHLYHVKRPENHARKAVMMQELPLQNDPDRVWYDEAGEVPQDAWDDLTAKDKP